MGTFSNTYKGSGMPYVEEEGEEVGNTRIEEIKSVQSRTSCKKDEGNLL